MKTRKTVLCVVLTLGVLLFLINCASTKTPLPTDNIDELLGTWGNPEYEGHVTGYPLGKWIFREDGTVELYDFIKGGNPYGVADIDVKEKWRDRKGSVNFKLIWDVPLIGSINMLVKISSDRKTLEMLWASRMELLPSEMDPDAPYCSYYILYRQ